MRLRLIDHGDGRLPVVVDSDTGEAVEKIVSINYSIDTDGRSLLILTLLPDYVDLTIEGTPKYETPNRNDGKPSSHND